jgi:dUTP pyrophosphatase
MALKIKLVNDIAKIPNRASEGAAGLDLFSVEKLTLNAKGSATIDTGIQIELPNGFFGQISGRSGLARHHGIIIGGGVIDNDYRGNIQVILFNLSDCDFEIEPGMKIAQLICLPYALFPISLEVSLSPTERNASGFGSTGC